MLISPPDRGAIRPARVRGKVVNISISACAEHYRVRSVRFNLAVHQIASDNAACFAVDHDKTQHLGPREHFDFSRIHLALESLVSTQ